MISAATLGELRIGCLFPIQDIREFELDISQNRHASILIKGSLPEKEGDAFIEETLEGSVISAWIREEVVFCGLITEVRISHEGHFYGIVLRGSSFSQRLDVRKRDRSFQDTALTYGGVIRSVLAGWQGAGAGFWQEGEKIPEPVYQIGETDWEFLLRMASTMRVGIFPSVTSERIRIQVGLPQGSEQDAEGSGLTIWNTWGKREGSVPCLEVSSYANWEIGDRISAGGAEQSVIRKSCRLKQGLLLFHYTLGKRTSLSVALQGNPRLSRLMIPGTVEEIKAEQVRVRFDLDAGQEAGELYWYPWHPEVGNLMYCMPEEGQRVYVRLGNEQGMQAEAVYGIHENGAGHPEMNPRDRYFTTAENKRLYMLPDSLGFTDLKQASPLQIALEDEQGIRLTSNKGLKVIAKRTVGIKGKSVSLQAPKEISIVRRGGENPTVINLCNGFDSIGATNEVSMSGAGSAGFPVFPSLDEEDKLGVAVKAVAVSTPHCGFRKRMEQQVEGIFVDRILAEEESWPGALEQTGGKRHG